MNIRQNTWLSVAGAVLGLGLSSSALAGPVEVDKALPDYTPASGGVSGSIKSVGSDSMNNLMTLWGEGFVKLYPNVKIEIDGKGSSTAPPALISGAANFGPMSREMKSSEINDFEKKFGYKPVALQTGIDMLAVFVHKDNPIKGLNLAQLDAIFSKTRKRGGESDLGKWGQLGLKGDWEALPLSLYGRNSASGTYGFFKEHALGNGDYKDTVKEQPGTSAVVSGVAKDKGGIGYGGIGYKTADVKAVPLADKGDKFVDPVVENAYSGDYPLSRFLLIYINYKPGSELKPLEREFIRYIFSKQGQEVVIKDGYFPVTADIARDNLKAAGITPTF